MREIQGPVTPAVHHHDHFADEATVVQKVSYRLQGGAESPRLFEGGHDDTSPPVMVEYPQRRACA